MFSLFCLILISLEIIFNGTLILKIFFDFFIQLGSQIIKKGNVVPWLWNYAGIVPPLSVLTVGVAGTGVNVTAPEPDSIVRKMPILIAIGEKIYI